MYSQYSVSQDNNAISSSCLGVLWVIDQRISDHAISNRKLANTANIVCHSTITALTINLDAFLLGPGDFLDLEVTFDVVEDRGAQQQVAEEQHQ